ncbi:MAG TPA: hypothetical protein VMY88_12650 [Acidimicrobiales bacterium]|nr:hypothetical protein [Acidimicrobiales bacterium]
MKRGVSLICILLIALGVGACSEKGEHAEDHGDNGTQTTASGAGTTATEADPGEGGELADPGDHEHENATFPAAEATDIAKISMRDYAFVDMPATITGPKLRIEASNNGPSAHEIVIFDADGNEVGGIKPIPSGESAEISLELTAGTYEMRCQIAISETKTHFDEGMKAVFAVM